MGLIVDLQKFGCMCGSGGWACRWMVGGRGWFGSGGRLMGLIVDLQNFGCMCGSGGWACR